MLLKKSSLAICSSGSLSLTFSLPAHASITSSPSVPSTTPSSTSTSTTLCPRKNTRSLPKSWQGTRSYATVQDGSHPPDLLKPSSIRKASPSPPPTWPTTPNPTPYEIFAQTRTAPYSKKTFYQLVKLYHPDRHPHSSPNLSHTTKLDRYRLVVAANTILSDPAKRHAYDHCGAGWGSHRDNIVAGYASHREADRAWRSRPGNAAGNATWEDWERWHQERAGARGERQSPLYMNNGLFVGALALFVMFGSWGQATRAGNHSVQLIEMRENSSQSISEDMWRRRKEKAVLGREERIDTFLKSREGWALNHHEDHVPKD